MAKELRFRRTLSSLAALLLVASAVATAEDKKSERDPCDVPASVDGEVAKPIGEYTPPPKLRPADLAAVGNRSVRIEAVINCKGRVVSSTIEDELPERVERILFKTLRRWRFKPARTEDGESVAVVFKLAVDLVATRR